MKKIAKFFIGVKKEMARVRWPKKKEMITYSVATIVFVIFFALFFSILDFTIAGLKTLVR